MIDVLLFAEDPGAANFVAPLPPALTRAGLTATVASGGLATERLVTRGLDVRPVDGTTGADALLDAVGPRVVVAGTAENPDTIGLALIAAARARGVPTVGVVDAPMNAEQRFSGASGDALAYRPDWLCVADEWTKRLFASLGFPAARVVVTGHPHGDHVREVGRRLDGEGRAAVRRRLLPAEATGRTVVVFVAEGSARSVWQPTASSLSATALAGRGAARGRTELVLEAFLDAIGTVTPRPYLVLRPHPKDRPDDYRDYAREFDAVSTADAALELVYAADLVVGATSFLLLEAALLERATLSIVPRAEEGTWLASVREGITPCATTPADVRSRLAHALAEPMPRIDLDHIVSPGAAERTARLISDLVRMSARPIGAGDRA